MMIWPGRYVFHELNLGLGAIFRIEVGPFTISSQVVISSISIVLLDP